MPQRAHFWCMESPYACFDDHGRFDVLIHSLSSTRCVWITGRRNDFEQGRIGMRSTQDGIVPSDCINLFLRKGDPWLRAATQESLLNTALPPRHSYLRIAHVYMIRSIYNSL